MKYVNEKLNITIENAEYFEIVECLGGVKLGVGGLAKFQVFGNSTVHAYGSSTVHAQGFAAVFQKSRKVNISIGNHFGAIVSQVFKTKRKMRVYKKFGNNAIAELEIPRGAIFQSASHGKCRTESAKVISITSIDGQTGYTGGYAHFDTKFIYRVGEVVRTDYNPEIRECSTGIHFFLTRREAEQYEL